MPLDLEDLKRQQMLTIEVINNGLRPINIQEVGFFLSDKTKIYIPSNYCTLGWLKEGDGISNFVPKSEIEKIVEEAKKDNIKIVAAYVRDSTNKYYKGKIQKKPIGLVHKS